MASEENRRVRTETKRKHTAEGEKEGGMGDGGSEGVRDTKTRQQD